MYRHANKNRAKTTLDIRSLLYTVFSQCWFM